MKRKDTRRTLQIRKCIWYSYCLCVRDLQIPRCKGVEWKRSWFDQEYQGYLNGSAYCCDILLCILTIDRSPGFCTLYTRGYAVDLCDLFTAALTLVFL